MTDIAIDTYIRENRAKHTREAIRETLLAAGHESAAIEEARLRIAQEPAVLHMTGASCITPALINGLFPYQTP